MAGLYSGHYHVFPKQLSPPASKVEKALEEYQSAVTFPHFVTGHVEDSPVIKISISEPDQKELVYEKPYVATEELYSVAEPSQVGTAKKTVYRFDARKSREYSNVLVLNDSWNNGVEAVCDQVRQTLAPGATKVNAELHKLLIYSKGDFFNRHQDAQYSARMFATLLFFLPVKYSGGEFVLCDPVQRRHETVVEHKEDHGCTWVAFYTDINHKVGEVKDGFRVVLNYCLSFEGEMSPSHALPKFNQSIASTIQGYFATARSYKQHLAIPLIYQYTLATLSPTFLKGADACLFSAFESIAVTELRFVLQFEKTKIIPPKIYYDDPFDNEADHEQIFQGILVVKHETAQKYMEIGEKYDKELDTVTGDRKAYYDLRQQRDKEYAALTTQVKSSQMGHETEWIVKRDSKGRPDWSRVALRIEQGSMGWLGNMTPAAEYYYLTAAIVVTGKK